MWMLLIPLLFVACNPWKKDEEKDSSGPKPTPPPSQKSVETPKSVEKGRKEISSPATSSSSGVSIYVPLISEGNRTVRTDLEGNPALGRVIHIRDLHGMVNDEDPGKTSLEILIASARYQAEVLHLLEQRRPRHIFMEGYSRDVSRQDLLKEFNNFPDFPKVAPVISGVIPDSSAIGKGGAWDIAYWTTALFMLGGVKIYASRHDDVMLHRVATSQENDEAYDWFLKQYSEYVKTHGENHEAVVGGTTFLKVNERRENWLEREIETLMQKPQWQRENPDREVWVSFGMAHRLCDNFQSAKFNPQILSVYWTVSDLSLQSLFTSNLPAPCAPSSAPSPSHSSGK